MFTTARFDTTQFLPRDGEAIWDYWLSLSPMAPFFGVPWRFGDIQVVPPAPKPKPAKPAKPARKAKSPIKPDAEEAEVVTADAAPEPAAETVLEAVAETVAEPVAEPVAESVVETVAETAVEPAAEPVAEAPATRDELTLIKGIGPKMAEKLHAAGVTRFAQIAAWDAAVVAEMEATLGGLPGAITRADWVGQAKQLA